MGFANERKIITNSLGLFNLLVAGGFGANGAIVLVGGGAVRAAGGARIPDEPVVPLVTPLPNCLNKKIKLILN
jgi:hypothetical protein